ncbi:MAG: 50S ribosomal protein L9 [Patescibacteria group bacterium]
MQIILLKNVDKLGKRGEIKQVSDGHALNFLIPQKLATTATPEKIKALEVIEKTKNKKEDKVKSELHKIDNKSINIEKEASDKGKLFAAISDKEIVELIKKKYNVDLKQYKFKISDHPKEVGDHRLKITVSGQEVTIAINISKK